MVQHVLWWRGKRGAMVEKERGPFQRNVVIIKKLINSVWGRKDKRMVKLDFFKNTLFGHIFK